MFDSFSTNHGLQEWLKKEASRQIQKSLQNRIGEFHQNILGSCAGWEIIDSVIDIKNEKRKIIAEIKNKYNTTKGSDKKALYENIKNQLNIKFKGYVGYYVEVIPRRPQRYDLPFDPSDNLKGSRKKKRNDIRKIDGSSFYSLATGYDTALEMLYHVLPHVVEDITHSGFTSIKSDPLFLELFSKTFK